MPYPWQTADLPFINFILQGKEVNTGVTYHDPGHGCLRPNNMNLLFIVNPIAGKGKASAINSIAHIEEYCTRKGIAYRIVKTEYKGHATILARQAVNSETKYDAVISVGGDGTLLEVANGLMGSDILLGVIPAGSGNDFARTIGIKPAIRDALRAIRKKKSRLIDVGRLNDNFFLNVASIGFDAEIAHDITKYRKLFPGRAAYYMAAFIKFLTYKDKEITLNIDGNKIQSKILLVAIANGNYYGGGMKVNPNGMLDDGYFNVIVIDSVPRYKFPFHIFKFIKGDYQYLPYVKTYRCKEISIESKDKLHINADGEILGTTPVLFNIKPLALNIIGGYN
jgi:diacylglycerol kinase (ATP)